MSEDLEMEEALAGLRARYRAGLSTRLEAVSVAWMELCARGVSPNTCEPLRELVHRIAGTAGSFGLPEVTEAAREVELILVPLLTGSTGAEPSPELRASMQSLLQTMNSACGITASA